MPTSSEVMPEKKEFENRDFQCETKVRKRLLKFTHFNDEAQMSYLSRRGLLLVSSCAGMSAFGFSLVLLGTLFGFPQVRERLHVDVLKQGGMSSLLILGMFVSTSLVGPVIDRFGNKVVLAVSSFLVAIAFVWFAFVNSFAMACVSAVLLGFGGGGLNTSTNVVVSEVFPDKRGAMLNILAVFFGAGAVTVPLLAVRVSPNSAMIFAAGYAALCGFMFLFVPFPPAREAHSFTITGALRVMTYPGLLLISTLLFFESANEQVTHTFASTWIGAAGASPKLATMALMGYMAVMALGRIAAVRLLKSVQKQKLVMVSAMFSFAGAAMLCVSQSATWMALGVVVTALGFSTIYPTVLAIAGDQYQKFAGTVFGTLFAIALVGAFVAPTITGAIGRQTQVHWGTLVPLFGTAAVTLTAMILYRSAPVLSADKLDEVCVSCDSSASSGK